MRSCVLVVAMLVLAACDNFTPREKVATYDRETGELVMPYPCTDWSQSQVHNYKNELHSNYGCAVNTNLALQLEDPQDLVRGHGTEGPDGDISIGVIKQYREGKLPAALTPMQGSVGSIQ